MVVVAQAGLQLGRDSFRDRHGGAAARAAAYLAVGAAAVVLVGPLVVVALLACGLAELAWARRHAAAIVVWPAVLVLAARAAQELPPLAWTAAKVGALSYGGGFVIIPLMQGDAIAHDWMTSAGFANAVAFGQITPGPVTHTVALVGWAAAGPVGALLATVIAFAPSFLAILLGGAAFERLRSNRSARTFLDGAGPAAIGAILGAGLTLAGALEAGWQFAVLAGAALLLALGSPPLVALLAGAAAGLAAAALGLTLPPDH